MMINHRVSQRALWHCIRVLTGTTLLLTGCQQEAVPDESMIVGDVYTVVDQPPVPPGGTAGLSSYLAKTIRYPLEAQKGNIQGKVVVGFVVTTAGRIADVQATQRIGGGCDEEAVRVVKQMPDWTPGRLNGKLVNVRTSLPVSFTIL